MRDAQKKKMCACPKLRAYARVCEPGATIAGMQRIVEVITDPQCLTRLYHVVSIDRRVWRVRGTILRDVCDELGYELLAVFPIAE